MKKKVTLNLLDLIMLFNIIVTLSFRDYTQLVIITNVITLFFTTINILRKKNFNESIFGFMYFKLFFIIFCCFSLNWHIADYPYSIILSLLFRLIFALSIIFYIDSREKYNKLIRYSIYASIILCIRILAQVPLENIFSSRIGTYLSHDPKNSYGNTGITYVLGLVAIYLFTNENHIKNKKIRIMLLIIFVTFSLLSGSKKQIILLLIYIICSSLYKSDTPKKMAKNFVVVFFSLFLINFALHNVSFLYETVGVRVDNFVNVITANDNNSEDLSTISRIYFLEDSLNVFTSSPFIGIGIDGYKYVNKYQFSWAENNYLELLADLGIIGFLIYYFPYFIIISSIKNQRKRKDNYALENIMLLLSLLFIDLSMVSYNETFLQFFLAILYANHCLVKKERKMESTENIIKERGLVYEK